MSRRPESERSDWTDLDLLTREEAHGRLVEEIAASEARLAELGAADGAERDLLDSRLRALREAAEDLIPGVPGVPGVLGIPGDTTNRDAHGTS